jgi:hypothetical protein
MSVLDRLSATPGVYWGEGRGPAGGRFVARIELHSHDDGSLTFGYETWSPAGGLQHAESARMARTGSHVTLAATSSGDDDTMVFREGETGVFGSVGSQRVGLVITPGGEALTFSWWWTGKDGQLREQSRAVVAPMRGIVAVPDVPGHETEPAPPRTAGPAERPAAAEAREPTLERFAGLRRRGVVTGEGAVSRAPALPSGGAEPSARVSDDDRAGSTATSRSSPLITRANPVHGSTPGFGSALGKSEQPAEDPRADGRRPSDSDPAPAPTKVPWPGILVLHGSGTGLVAQRLAARLTRAAVVRTDLFDRAVRGTAGRPDPALRQRIAVSVVQGYAATGHPVILHGTSSREEHEELVNAIADAGLTPVQLVEVSDGEDYGEIARRLIDSD